VASPWSLSVLVEWDNVRLSEMARCRAMLRAVGRQLEVLCRTRGEEDGTLLGQMCCPAQLVIAYCEDEVDGGLVRQVVEAELAPCRSSVSLDYLAARSARYFTLKNLAAERAGGDILVFIDSDVIPEDGWLRNLLLSFDTADVAIVGGHTYIDATSLYEKAVALTWFFPRRLATGSLERYPQVFANNLAVRATLFRRFPFPDSTTGARGGSVALLHNLGQARIDVYRNGSAQVSHPAPNGLRHFLERAVAQGRDAEALARNAGVTRPSWLRRTLRAWRDVVVERRKVRLSLAGVPVALLIGTAYYTLVALGGVASRVSPRCMDRHFRL